MATINVNYLLDLHADSKDIILLIQLVLNTVVVWSAKIKLHPAFVLSISHKTALKAINVLLGSALKVHVFLRMAILVKILEI